MKSPLRYLRALLIIVTTAAIAISSSVQAASGYVEALSSDGTGQYPPADFQDNGGRLGITFETKPYNYQGLSVLKVVEIDPASSMYGVVNPGDFVYGMNGFNLHGMSDVSVIARSGMPGTTLALFYLDSQHGYQAMRTSATLTSEAALTQAPASQGPIAPPAQDQVASSRSNPATFLDPWVGNDPNAKENGKTFYNEVGFDDRSLSEFFNSVGLNLNTIKTSRVSRHNVARRDNIKDYYYIIGYCTVGRSNCTPTNEKAEALLTASVSLWPSGDTNFAYEMWAINQKQGAMPEPVWCVTKGPHLRAPIDVRALDCRHGTRQSGWGKNEPVPYTQSGVVYDDDYGHWISSGYEELSGFNDVGKAFLEDINRAMTSDDSSPSSGEGRNCHEQGLCQGEHSVIGGKTGPQ